MKHIHKSGIQLLLEHRLVEFFPELDITGLIEFLNRISITLHCIYLGFGWTSAVRRYCFMDETQNLIRLARGKGNVLHRTSAFFERDDNPGILQEIERNAVSFANEHEVYPGSPHPHHDRYLIEGASCHVIERHSPSEDAKC